VADAALGEVRDEVGPAQDASQAPARSDDSDQDYDQSEVSPYFRTNGYPPISAYPQAKGDDDTYERLLAGRFADYRLEVSGMV